MQSINRKLVLVSLMVIGCPVLSQDSYNTTLIGRWTEDSCQSLEVADDYLYVTTIDSEIVVLDISDPSNSFQVGLYRIAEGHSLDAFIIDGDYAYVIEDSVGTCRDNYLHILDISTPTYPVQIGDPLLIAPCEMGLSVANNLIIQDALLFIQGDDDAGIGVIIIYDISNPTTPVEIGGVSNREPTDGNIAVNDENLYWPSWGGISIFNIQSIVTDSIEVSNSFWHCNCWASRFITIANNFAFVQNYNNDTLRVLILDDPMSPIQEGAYPIGNEVIDFNWSWIFAYVTTDSSGLRILDMIDPANPAEIGYFDPGIGICDMLIKDGYVYLAASDSGLYIIQNNFAVSVNNPNSSLPTDFFLNQNFPNPFNPTTTIRYALPVQSTVILTVCDIRGQEVITLHDAVKSPGNYEVQWDGMDQSGIPVSTGVYFARLQAGSYSQTIKMVYLR